MSIKSQLDSLLSSLATFSEGCHTLKVADANQQFDAELLALDALALAFEHVTLTSQSMAMAPIEQLKKVADGLSRRLTYLLEPISPVEVDADQCVVQLRSNPPHRDENGTRYYELLIRRGGVLSLRRFQKQPGGARQAIRAQVTREVFLRLVGDFSEIAQ